MKKHRNFSDPIADIRTLADGGSEEADPGDRHERVL